MPPSRHTAISPLPGLIVLTLHRVGKWRVHSTAGLGIEVSFAPVTWYFMLIMRRFQ